MSAGSGTSALTLQMLQWLRAAAELRRTLEAWKTSCPRLTIWEDAVSEGLVQVERGAVVLTSAAAAASSTWRSDARNRACAKRGQRASRGASGVTWVKRKLRGHPRSPFLDLADPAHVQLPLELGLDGTPLDGDERA